MKEQLKHVRLTCVIFDPPAAASDSSIRRVVYYSGLAASATEGSKSQARNQIFLLEWSHPSFPFSLPFPKQLIYKAEPGHQTHFVAIEG